jgi:hypothetical protein
MLQQTNEKADWDQLEIPVQNRRYGFVRIGTGTSAWIIHENDLARAE